MGSFSEWFNKKLKVTRFPVPSEIGSSDFDYIINVSDEYIPDCATIALRTGKKYFWFPMNECNGDIGLNSLYGALQILFIAEGENAKVCLHCHGGANRSPTVADAYFFLRTKKHRERKKNENVDINFDPPFVEDKENKNNRLLDNVDRGFIPAKRKIEKFLINCEIAFNHPVASRGGMIDWCKIEAKF